MEMHGALERAEQLKKRTKQFALRVLKMCREIPDTDEGRVIKRQVLRSGTSVGANYRAVCRARSAKEFVSKIGVVVEEADETAFWFELLVEGEILPRNRMDLLLKEVNELLAIFSASQRTAKRRLHAKRRKQ